MDWIAFGLGMAALGGVLYATSTITALKKERAALWAFIDRIERTTDAHLYPEETFAFKSGEWKHRRGTVEEEYRSLTEFLKRILEDCRRLSVHFRGR